MRNIFNKDINEKFLGIAYIFLTYSIWGVQALYWRELKNVSMFQILAQRIIWSFVFVIVIVAAKGYVKEIIFVLKDKKKLKLIIISSLLISSNWFLNVYAAYSNQIIEASIGQYMTPIFTLAMGILIFKEETNKYYKISLILAALGVIVLMIRIGKIPLIAVLLTLTFGSYSVVKKITKIDSIINITIEMGILFPLALVYIFFFSREGYRCLIEYSIYTKALLISTGLFTGAPLLMFAYGTQKVPFSLIGYIQYLAPSLSLLVGIIIFKEKFTTTHLLSLGFIWLSIFISIISNFKR